MHGDVLVALLVTAVLRDEMQVVATDHNRPLHLVLRDHAAEDATTDGDVGSEGAFLVDVRSLNGLNAR